MISPLLTGPPHDFPAADRFAHPKPVTSGANRGQAGHQRGKQVKLVVHSRVLHPQIAGSAGGNDRGAVGSQHANHAACTYLQPRRRPVVRLVRRRVDSSGAFRTRTAPAARPVHPARAPRRSTDRCRGRGPRLSGQRREPSLGRPVPRVAALAPCPEPARSHDHSTRHRRRRGCAAASREAARRSRGRDRRSAGDITTADPDRPGPIDADAGRRRRHRRGGAPTTGRCHHPRTSRARLSELARHPSGEAGPGRRGWPF